MTIKLVSSGVKKLTHLAARAGRSFPAVLPFLWLVSSAVAVAQGNPPAPAGFPAALDSYIEKAVSDWEVPGLAIAIVRNDSVLVAKGYGVRELGKPGRVDGNTIFNIASLTKSFTAAAAAMLVDEGKLAWDAPARRYLPSLEFSDPYLTAQITMRDLLSHRTGLQPANMMWQLSGISRAEILRRARFLKPERPFRTEQVYSNVGYTIAGEAIAAAAGLSYEDVIRQRIFAPLGMKSTTIGNDGIAQVTNKVAPHTIIGGVQRSFPWRNNEATMPAGGINSSASDMAIWLRFQMGDGALAGKRLISAAQMWEMHSPQAIIPVTAGMKRGRQVEGWAAYGLGWNIMDYRGHPMIWHSGNGPGQPVLMTIFPDDHLAILVMLNTWAAGILHGMITNKIADTYLGFPPRDWSGEMLPRKPEIRGTSAKALADLQKLGDPKAPASHDLAAYAGTYGDSLFGDQTVRLTNGGLTLQMGGPRGEIADLTHLHHDTFLAMWRDPVYREDYPSLLTFAADSQGAISQLTMHLNRDHIVAYRAVTDMTMGP